MSAYRVAKNLNQRKLLSIKGNHHTLIKILRYTVNSTLPHSN